MGRVIIKTKSGDKFSTDLNTMKTIGMFMNVIMGKFITFTDAINKDAVTLPIENIDYMIVRKEDDQE